MERESFDVTDYDWDTEKSSDVGSEVVGGSSNLGSSASVKDKRACLSKQLASVSHQLKRLTSVSLENKTARSVLRKSTALEGLRFISKADSAAGWTIVQGRFVEITATTGRFLPRSKFGECIGMDSIDFALELFDALARRRHMTADMIDQDQLRDFWEQISDQSFFTRLYTFFDMMDKDSDGRLTEDEIREIINLSSSTNNLPNIQKRTYEYAAMIMEELDPDDMGYIMMESLETLLLHAETQHISRRWYSGLRYFVADSWQTTSMHLAVPACERLIRPFRSSTVCTVTILKVAFYAENVLNLHLSRPRNFKYESGQYMFVNCSTISKVEWHPFSITSTPQDDYLSVHIKVMGDWTNDLSEVFSKVCEPPLVRDMHLGAYNHDFPKIMIDGPYNAPAQDYKKYEVVLLVGLGIGVTPMISIIKDIINNTEATEHSRQLNVMETRKAYLYWLAKEQASYSWFQNIMNEVTEGDINRVIEVNNYCTNVYEEGDVRSAFLRILQSINHSKNGMDIVYESRVMTHFAKPDWKKVYKQIAMNHYGSHVGVFYCGEVALVEELRQLALEFTHNTETRFSFHKENFYPQC